MKSRTSGARILVATDNGDDARQIARQLGAVFEHVRTSTDADRTAQDFEDVRPAVLVLAFDNLEKAQRYYLGLYRHGGLIHEQPHRTVILCGKDETREVFGLCQQAYFDDYVLYWPQSFDGCRLAMSVWNACRDVVAQPQQAPSARPLLAHARRIDGLEQMLDAKVKEGEQHAAAVQDLLTQADRDVDGAIDQFTRRLLHQDAASPVAVQDSAALTQEVERLKQQAGQLSRSRRGGAQALDAWTRDLRSQLEPAISGLRALATEIRSIRPLVMIVDDDRYIRELIATMLKEGGYEFAGATDATQALTLLRRMQPDVFLVDIGLPGMDGVALMKRLRATPSLASIPIVAMTADSRRETLLRSVEAGASAFVVKPFNLASLKERLDKVLLC